jgi:hypothetical protein
MVDQDNKTEDMKNWRVCGHRMHRRMENKNMRSRVLILVFLAGMAIGSPTAAGPSGPEASRPPLPPEGIRVVQPDSKVPDEIRGFSGSWYGEWVDPGHPDQPIREILVVEEMVSKDDIKLVYSWGACPVCKSKAGWRRFKGKMVNICIAWHNLPKPFSQVNTDALGQKKVLCFRYPEGRTFTFVLDDKDQLIGTDGAGAIIMSRLK